MSRGEKETLLETMRSLKIEVHSYKEENERLMREKKLYKCSINEKFKSITEANKEWIKLKTKGRRKI
jgi:hypothetical protein